MCGKLSDNDVGNAPQHFVSRRTFLIAGGIGLTGSVGSMMSRAAPSSSGGVSGETGTVTADQPNEETWRSVSLSGTYEAPVVVTTPLSYNGAQPAHVRLRNVSSDGFEFQIEEWGYLDGPHIDETLQYVAMEAGTYDLPNGALIQAGTVETTEEFFSVSFQRSFSTTPVVVSQSQTYNGLQPIVTRNGGVAADGFYVGVQEAEWRGEHTTETVGYVAIEGTVAAGFEAGTTPNAVTDDWGRIGFEREHESPVFVAGLQTYNGPDAAGLRYRDLDSSGVEVFVEEEQSADEETNHTTERVGYLVTTPGELFGSGGGGGGGGGGDDGDGGGRIIDDFGGGLTAYEGDTGQFTDQETVVASGTSAVECVYSGSKRSIGSTSGLRRYPQPGETFRVAVGATEVASGPRIGFATQGTARSAGRYQVYADIERDELYFSRRDGAGWTTLASSPASLSSDRWYDIEVQWTANNEFTVGLYAFGGDSAIAEVTAADDTYTSGGIQMTTIGRGTDTTMYFDYWRVTGRTPTYGGSPEPEPEPDSDGAITGPVERSNTGQGCGATPAPNTSNAVNAGDHGSIQAAIDVAASQSRSAVVVPSGTHREGKIRARSGVALVGEDGATIESTAAESISIENVSDVHIHNLRVKAKEQNAGRVIGSGSPGKIRDITISDCTLSGNANGVSLRLMEDNEATNVTIRHCDISAVDRHGVFFGTDDVDGAGKPTGFIESPTIVNNHVHDMYRWMAITLAGRETAQCSDGYVAGNYVDASMWSHIGRNGANQKHDNWTNHGITFEEWVVDTVVEHNYVDDFQKTGIGCTGGARRNTFRFNEVIDSRMGIRCAGHLPHPDDPTQNEFHDNVFRKTSKWAVFNKESGGRNYYHDNLFTGSSRIYNERIDRFAENTFE